jgi:acyl carrier protein
MIDAERRLEQCFAVVFPTLTKTEIRNATPETVPAWDSIAMIHLATVIDDEFGTLTEPETLVDLNSFGAFLEYVRERGLLTAS